MSSVDGFENHRLNGELSLVGRIEQPGDIGHAKLVHLLALRQACRSASIAYRRPVPACGSDWCRGKRHCRQRRRTTVFGVISNTADCVRSHTARLHIIIRFCSRSSFSASSTVVHSSSSRRKHIATGVPSKIHAAANCRPSSSLPIAPGTARRRSCRRTRRPRRET